MATYLFLTQVYRPDPASVGQHLADAAAELVRRGHRVVVFTANRGYDDPSLHYPDRDVLQGVEVHRLPWCSFGKGSIPIRLLGAISFVLQAFLRGLHVRDLGVIVVSTVPPMASLAAVLLSVLRGPPIKFWVMDLNPDQLIALRLIGTTSLTARLFDRLNRAVLTRAASVIVLDRFMAERVQSKLPVTQKLTVIPPWPLDDFLEPIRHEDNPFRREHNLAGKLVVMYSGNHSPSNPLKTIIETAQRMADEPRLVFYFVGGGTGKRDVELAARSNPNIRSLPYEPLDRLKYSLSAADVHLVAMGNEVVGMVHPCKVYGALAVARPILFLGPEPSHIADMIMNHRIGWRIPHGDVAGAESLLRGLLSARPEDLAKIGEEGRRLVMQEFSKETLCGRLADVLERDGGVSSSNQAQQPPTACVVKV
jgi:glycosyltransferase involved in cell wall biosynthesis